MAFKNQVRLGDITKVTFPEKVLRRQIGDINTPVSIACNLELNRFRGKTSLQLMIVDIEVSH